ncbi:MAG: DUF4373 domain-containing protein [Bacteroides sp.]|uniref:DUF4373 domain-containing protein n=1 Tax=Bacteroides sp. TaxID=29523 RepID=UPI001B7A79AF|nr:DUF4373 domain-containing protein [Bacteroides sp.]MBP9586674.1 DUF4373 domain-containing protein [Bacteroides sp.]
MATEYFGLSYFPLNTNFFEKELQELLEAKYGIKGPYIVIKLLCKIFADSYYLSWGDDQCLIFTRKLGKEFVVEEVEQVVNLLIERGFFDKELYHTHHILTSEPIQRVWVEATSRRKRDLSRLPYLMVELTNPKNASTTGKKGNKTATEEDLNPENAVIFEQSKVKQSKVKHSPPLSPSAGEEERETEEGEDCSLVPPAYALNKLTHNYEGLMENLSQLKITDRQEVKAILRLSNYGEKDKPIWKVVATTNWAKISARGRYLIKVLRSD